MAQRTAHHTSRTRRVTNHRRPVRIVRSFLRRPSTRHPRPPARRTYRRATLRRRT